MTALVSSLLLFCLAVLAVGHNVFSGVYTPNVHYSLESYAGAWLIKRDVFMTLDRMIDGMASLETASTMVVQNHRITPIMTRDYFDFQVEHLSSTTNQLLNHNADEVLLHRLIAKGRNFRRIAEQYAEKHSDVLVIIPFSTNAASEMSTAKTMLQKLRWGFFINTFFSIYRYFPRVIVYVSSEADKEQLLSAAVPAYDIVVLPQQAQGWQHPRQALRYTYDRLGSDNSLDWVRFVYYSEGDQILHLRHGDVLLDLLQRFQGEKSLALVPHRMQTIALPKDVPPSVRDATGDAFKLQKLEGVTLIIENATLTRGSCCDNGRFNFKDCGNWWYNCRDFGLNNFTTWLKFGHNGFTMPSGTEHKGRCSYSPHRVQCPGASSSCSGVPMTDREICKELDNVEG